MTRSAAHLNRAAARKCSHVEPGQARSGPNFRDKVSQRRDAAPVEPSVEMIPAEAQEHFRAAGLPPALIEKVLHHRFATSRRLKCRAAQPIRFDLESPK